MILRKIAVATGFAIAVGTLHAQQFDNAASVEFGSFDLTPSLDAGLRYDDNITSAASDTISSWSRLISPQLLLQNSFGSSQVSFGYRLRNEDYFSSSEDNYTDHFLSAQVDYELNSRHRLDVSLDYSDAHEARGTGFSIGLGDALTRPDTFKQSELDILYSYGAVNADGRVELNLNRTNRDYDLATPAYLARDRSFSGIGATFFYRVGATTDLTLDANVTHVDYPNALNPASPLDSTVSSFLVGVDWEATAQTSGFVKVGYEEKDFDSAVREDFDGFDWAAGVLWEPSEYATLELTSRNDTNETNGEGNFIQARNHRIEWRHEWLERLRTSASYSWGDNRYEGQIEGFSVREDDITRFRASAFYEFRRWLSFEASYILDERDSNRDTVVYDRNQFLINAQITL